MLSYFEWKEKAKKLTKSHDRYYFYEMYGRYCNNVRNGKWNPTKILPK